MTDGAIGSDKLNLSSATAEANTVSSSSSQSYEDGSGANISKLIKIGKNGKLAVSIGALIWRTGTISDAYMSFALSGANNIAANDTRAIANRMTDGVGLGRSFLLEGLTAGDTTVTLKYRVGAVGGVCSAVNKSLSLITF